MVAFIGAHWGVRKEQIRQRKVRLGLVNLDQAVLLTVIHIAAVGLRDSSVGIKVDVPNGLQQSAEENVCVNNIYEGGIILIDTSCTISR